MSGYIRFGGRANRLDAVLDCRSVVVARTTEYYRLPCGRFRLNGLADHHSVLTDATIEHHYYNVRLESSNTNLH